ncbi:MAG: polynucleotide adenylyltransferase PcnB [bacterium]
MSAKRADKPTLDPPSSPTSTVQRIPADEHAIDRGLICPNAIHVIETLNQHGYEAYLVGGAVRDLMLGHAPKDFDIATSALPEQVRKIFSSCRLIGRRFRLAHIYFGRQYLEVATFRAPHEQGVAPMRITRKSADQDKNRSQGFQADDGRIIQDNVYGTVEQDVWRRDFTVNALLYNVQTQEVLDYVGGVDDLTHRTLRMIGDPQARYREDPVRMLRAIRFAAKLDFTLDPATGDIIPSHADLLSRVSPARLFDETLKLLHGGKAANTFQHLREYGLLSYLFPSTEAALNQNHDKDQAFLATFITQALHNTDSRVKDNRPVNPAFLFAVMLWFDAEKRARILREDGCPNLQSYHVAATEIFKEQAKFTALPKRNTITTRDIWALQARFDFKDCRRAKTFMTHPRFRAAYDFLCLRAHASGLADDIALCDWWTSFQNATERQQEMMCQAEKAGKYKRKRKRNKPNKPASSEQQNPTSQSSK